MFETPGVSLGAQGGNRTHISPSYIYLRLAGQVFDPSNVPGEGLEPTRPIKATSF